jgi:glycosyltransferase involved in cell wall biosynthesis
MLSKNDRQRAIDRMRELAKQIDAFIVFNRFYAEFMRQLLDLPAEKIHVVSLGINTADFERFERRPKTSAAPTIGYLARLAPEKGLDLLVDAFIELHRRQSNLSTRLLLAGWLGKDNHGFATEQFAKLKAAGLEHAYEYLGVVDREQKLDFLARIDLLSVPTAIQDPKGLYVLESLAAGVPVVQPDHGAFPELLASTQGGRLVPPHSVDQLADALSEMLADRDALSEFGRIGQSNVMLRHTSEVMAQQTMDFYRRLIDANGVQ